jgi:AcrR family transcriptional regulator
MNKRQLSKAQTFEKILTVAKRLFSQKGVLNTSTAEIAKACGIAHGTVFLHFADKNTLMTAIFERELQRAASDIYQLAQETSQVEVLLDRYFEYVEQEEDFLSVIARELPFYPEELRRSILAQECILRHLFFTAIENGVAAGRFKPLDITTVVMLFFATVNYYLAHKPSFAPQGSVIQMKKEKLKQTFLLLLSM